MRAILPSVVSVRNLDFSFGQGPDGRRLLAGVDLDVSQGEIVILMGPSGSGKTTLLTLVGALRSAQHGSIVVLGRELVGAPAADLVAVRRKIGFIFQSHNLLSFLTASQNVRMALEAVGGLADREIDERVRESLLAVGLGERLADYPGTLSGGQKQRVAIARALVHQPRLILADEPTAALDRQSGREVVSLIQALSRQKRCAVLLVTHDSRILDIADRIVEMEDGRLRSGEPARLAPASRLALRPDL